MFWIYIFWVIIYSSVFADLSLCHWAFHSAPTCQWVSRLSYVSSSQVYLLHCSCWILEYSCPVSSIQTHLWKNQYYKCCCRSWSYSLCLHFQATVQQTPLTTSSFSITAWDEYLVPRTASHHKVALWPHHLRPLLYTGRA